VKWKFEQKIFLLMLSCLFIGCMSGRLTEDERYLLIKSNLAQERYSAAANKAREFEKDFPNSRYLCELWNTQIATYRKGNCCDFFLKQAEDNYKSKCPLIKDQNPN